MDRYPNACLEELEAFMTLWDVNPRVEESSLESLSVDEFISQLRQLCEDAEDRASNAQEEARQKRKEARGNKELIFGNELNFSQGATNLPFSGSDHEDANEHIEKVLKIMDLFHIPNITIDQVMLTAFLMSLTGAASHWLRNKPFGSITTWEDLKTKFLCKYCPPVCTAKKIEEINNFQQEPD
ncbi:hypothetical protein Tco_0843975 [Tanacetum coccineum]